MKKDQIFVRAVRTKNDFERKNQPDEELKKILRRAVKNVPVPAGLEFKVLNLIKK